MSVLSFINWINENKSSGYSKVTFIDIWRGYDTINFGDKQLGDDSPLAQVQRKLIYKLTSNANTKKWIETHKFRDDNDFGPNTAKALGLVINGKEYTDFSDVKIGPNTLSILGFKKPISYSLNVKILATTLVVEAGNGGNDEILAIASVISNRKKAINKYRKNKGGDQVTVIDIVLSKNQFSLWNGYQGISKEGMVASAMKAWRPENSKNWNDAVIIAKKLLYSKITDVTNGATHYYNPSIVTPIWSKGKTWVRHDLNLIHEFGRDTTTNWAKNPVVS